MFYYGYHFLGMHLIWWFVWLGLLFWIFILPYDIPGQRRKKDTPLDLLKRRYAMGQFTSTEYLARKKVLENDVVKQDPSIQESSNVQQAFRPV